jgi:hypothetical protein
MAAQLAVVDGGRSTVDAPALSTPAASSDPTRRDAAPGRRTWLGWIGTIAAAIVLSVVATSFVVGSRVDGELAAQDAMIATLEKVSVQSMAVSGEPDAEHVTLAGVTDPALGGSLVYSPSTAQLVVVASGLTRPPAGLEYRCWVEVAGQRERVGRMVFSDDLSYWTGPTPAVSGLTGPATFGVSLVAADGESVDTAPVLISQ